MRLVPVRDPGSARQRIRKGTSGWPSGSEVLFSHAKLLKENAGIIVAGAGKEQRLDLDSTVEG